MNLTNSIVNNVFEYDIHCIIHRDFRENPQLTLVLKTAKNPLSNWFYPTDTVNGCGSFSFLNQYLESSI